MCSIDDIRYLESKALACRKVYTRDRSIRFRNYVMGFCRQIQKRGIFELLEDKIQLARFNWLYKTSKKYQHYIDTNSYDITENHTRSDTVVGCSSHIDCERR